MSARSPSGFTLIEVIVAIVLTAIGMAAILPLLGSVFMSSHEPLMWMNEGVALQKTMENLVVWHTNGLESLRAHVGPETGSYSNFTVLHNRYVEFSGGNEVAAGSTNYVLKITLQNSQGEFITRLFARSLLEKP